MIYEIGNDVEKTLNGKCDEYEIYIEQEKNIHLDSLKSELNFAKEEITLGVGIRVIKDSKQGFAFTSNMDKLAETALKSCENTKLGKVDENYKFSEIESVPDVKGVYDKKIDDISLDETSEFLKDTIEKASQCEVTGASFTASKGKSLILNSNGVSIENNETGYGLGLSVKIETPTDIATAYNSVSSRFFDIDSDKLAYEVCDLAKRSLNTKSIETGDYNVVLDYYASIGLLQTFINAFNGENVLRGRSILKDKENSEITNPNLSILDNPLLERGMKSSKCDGEGVVSRKTELIKNGVLNSFIYDIYNAEITGENPTSNALRYSYHSTPQIEATNLEFKFSDKINIENIKNGVIVTSVLGAHTANPISGEFSVEASNAFKIENGELKYPIKKAMISGNIFEIMESIEGVESEIRQYGSYVIPKLYAHNLRVVGQ